MRRHSNRLRYSFKYMLECVKVTLRQLRQRGRSPLIAFELPESNWYWRQYQVMDLFIEFGSDSYLFHGCMYGMRAPSGPNEGMLMRKGWCIAIIFLQLGKPSKHAAHISLQNMHLFMVNLHAAQRVAHNLLQIRFITNSANLFGDSARS